MNKKNIKLYSISDMTRILDVPAYRIQHLFASRLLKREEYPRAGKTLLFDDNDLLEVEKLLGTIKTFKWGNGRKKAASADYRPEQEKI